METGVLGVLDGGESGVLGVPGVPGLPSAAEEPRAVHGVKVSASRQAGERT